MAMMTCKKCGSQIRAEDGVCPFCGAVYYILPQGEEGSQPIAGGASIFAGDRDVPSAVHQEPAVRPRPEDDFDAWLASLSTGGDMEHAQPSGPADSKEDLDATRVWSQPPGLQQMPESDVKIWPGSAGETTRYSVNEIQRRAQVAEPVGRQADNASQRTYDRAVQSRAEMTGRSTAQQTQIRRQSVQQRHSRPRDENEEYGVRSNPPSPPSRKRNHRGKRRFIALAVAVLAVLVVIICTMSGAFDFKKGSNQGSMPNLLGKDVEAAIAQLEDYHVTVKLQYQENEAADGTVILQDPIEGTALKRGDVVTLTVSGEEAGDSDVVSGTVILPDVTDENYDTAARELEAMGLKVSRSGDVYSDTVKSGNVASQSPEAGAKVEEGSTVILSVSQGPTPPTTWAVTVTVGSGGSVNPKGKVDVQDGKSATFTITPDEGYEIREVKVDGTDVGPVDSYTFSDVTADHTLYVVFQEKVAETPTPSSTPTEGGTTDPGDISQEPAA